MKDFKPDTVAIWQTIQPDYIACEGCKGLKNSDFCYADVCPRLESKIEEVQEWIDDNCSMLKLIKEGK